MYSNRKHHNPLHSVSLFYVGLSVIFRKYMIQCVWGRGKEWIRGDGNRTVRIATQMPFPTGTEIYGVPLSVSKYVKR